jgi:hypothetical protein
VRAIVAAFPGAELRLMEPTETEIQCVYAASQKAGEYLEWLGKTDLATMTEDEWLEFIWITTTAFRDKMAELSMPYVEERDCPF